MGKSEQERARGLPCAMLRGCAMCQCRAQGLPWAMLRVCAMCQHMCLCVRAPVSSLWTRFSLTARLQHKGIFG